MLDLGRVGRLLATLVLLSVASAAAAQAPNLKTGPATEVATFAGGCFWCVESDFDKVPGVISTVSGYMGGRLKNPTYRQVLAGGTGHAEVVQIAYDPSKVTYQRLLDYYWRTVDPLDAGGQFCDRGDQYRTAIFTHTAEQQRLATASKTALDGGNRFKQKIATQIVPAGEFTPAEEYHQDYHNKNPLKYKFYRFNCGRDARVKQVWGDEAGGKVPTQ